MNKLKVMLCPNSMCIDVIAERYYRKRQFFPPDQTTPLYLRP
mgnify:CR=1 FL=1